MKKVVAIIISWTLIILSFPFLLMSIIDFISTKDFVDIVILAFFLIPFSLSCIYLIKITKQRNKTQTGGKTKLKSPNFKSVREIKTLLEYPQTLLSQKTEDFLENIQQNFSPQPTELIKARNTASAFAPNNKIIFPDWYVSISFGQSSSNNYMKAVALAKSAPQYLEQTNDGKILHQAVYSSAPKEYLSFIMLYELVENWKSTFVIINGKFIDRKVIGQLNYCYGDKCRSGNTRFCYGASYMTENPFGCHRLQISACNNPWWSYYRKSGLRWVLDKNEMVQRINSYASIYCLCPSFNYDKIMQELNKLPLSVSEHQFQVIKKNAQRGIALRF